MQYLRRNISTVMLAFSMVVLSACGGSDDDDDDEITYNYNISSTTFFTGGQQVAVIRFGISGTCAAPTGVTSPITRVGAGTVNSAGAVSFSFTTDITPPMVESVYIDNNASGNLDNGDRVWGDDPTDLAAACFDSYGSNQTFDWEMVAAQIQATLGLLQPSVIYTGISQTFRNNADSQETDLAIDNTIVVDGETYEKIQW